MPAYIFTIWAAIMIAYMIMKRSLIPDSKKRLYYLLISFFVFGGICGVCSILNINQLFFWMIALPIGLILIIWTVIEWIYRT